MKREVISADPDFRDAPSPQYGAICWRKSAAGFDVLLISSRETGRWVVAKGWPIKGLDAPAIAAREAWEEAGVVGKVCDTCLGGYTYQKALPGDQSIVCTVALYGLRADKLARRFPERHERKRKWFSLCDAADLVAEPELSALLLALDRDAKDASIGAAKKLSPPVPAIQNGNG